MRLRASGCLFNETLGSGLTHQRDFGHRAFGCRFSESLASGFGPPDQDDFGLRAAHQGDFGLPAASSTRLRASGFRLPLQRVFGIGNRASGFGLSHNAWKVRASCVEFSAFYFPFISFFRSSLADERKRMLQTSFIHHHHLKFIHDHHLKSHRYIHSPQQPSKPSQHARSGVPRSVRRFRRRRCFSAPGKQEHKEVRFN